MFIKGIQPRDTTICKGSSIQLILPNSIPRNGLIAWYPFNGNSDDESGNGFNLQETGNVLPDTNRFGISNTAKYFGNNIPENKCNLPSGAMNSFNYLTSGTISFWVKIKSFEVTNHYFGFDNCFIIKQKNGSNTQLYIGLKGGTSKIRFHLEGGLPAGNLFESKSSLNLNKWYNIAVTWNGVNQNIFINGVLDSSINSTQTLSNMNDPDYFSIGSFSGTGSNGSFSVIDDVAFWNRSLSSNEIKQVFWGISASNRLKTKWSTGDTANFITINPLNNSTYSCIVSIGSFEFFDSINISINNQPSNIITYPKAGLCKNDTIILNAISGQKYNWYKNNTNIINNSNLLKVTNVGTYKVKITDSLGCTNTSNNITIFNAPLPKSKIIVNDTSLCFKDNYFLFTDSTKIDSGLINRIWDFGNGNTSTIIKPNQVFSSAGQYSVKLLSTSNYNCKDSAYKIITVKTSPIIGPMIGEFNALVANKLYTYTVAQQLNHTYNWTITNGILVSGQGTNSISVQWINNGNGSIKLDMINDKNCLDYINQTVKIGNVGVQEFGIHDVTIFPNPNNGSFSVSLINSIEENLCFQIHDLMGKELLNTIHFSKPGTQEIILNTNLNNGLYILTVIGSNNSLKKQILIN